MAAILETLMSGLLVRTWRTPQYPWVIENIDHVLNQFSFTRKPHHRVRLEKVLRQLRISSQGTAWRYPKASGPDPASDSPSWVLTENPQLLVTKLSFSIRGLFLCVSNVRECSHHEFSSGIPLQYFRNRGIPTPPHSECLSFSAPGLESTWHFQVSLCPWCREYMAFLGLSSASLASA